LDKIKETIDGDLEELQRLRRETTVVVPTGRLRLHHHSSKSEALWSPLGKVEAYGSSPDAEQAKQAWSAVAETLKTQQQDFVATWEGADRAIEDGLEVDVFPAMYDCARLAMEALSNVTSQMVAPHVAVVGSTGGSLADSLRDLLPRSQARIEVESYDTAPQEIQRLKREPGFPRYREIGKKSGI
jgi:hypothetical protein